MPSSLARRLLTLEREDSVTERTEESTLHATEELHQDALSLNGLSGRLPNRDVGPREEERLLI
jgi:hypothetical protein